MRPQWCGLVSKHTVHLPRKLFTRHTLCKIEMENIHVAERGGQQQAIEQRMIQRIIEPCAPHEYEVLGARCHLGALSRVGIRPSGLVDPPDRSNAPAPQHSQMAGELSTPGCLPASFRTDTARQTPLSLRAVDQGQMRTTRIQLCEAAAAATAPPDVLLAVHAPCVLPLPRVHAPTLPSQRRPSLP